MFNNIMYLHGDFVLFILNVGHAHFHVMFANRI